jgi:hypothetical protein
MDHEQVSERKAQLFARFDDIWPTLEMKNNAIATLLGSGVKLTSYFGHSGNFPINTYPQDIKYCMCLLINNMRAIQTDKSKTVHQDHTFDELDCGDAQERSHRILKKIVKIMYESVMEEEREEADLKRLCEDDGKSDSLRSEGASSSR